MRRLVLLVALLLLAPATAQATTFQSWGQASVGDCLYATAAAWEASELNLEPTETQVLTAWHNNQERQTPAALSHYWTHHPIDGIRARLTQVSEPRRYEAYIVRLDIGVPGAAAQWETYFREPFPVGEGHAVLMLEQTPAGVWVESWGKEWLLSWTEWRAMEPAYFAVHLER